MVAALIWANASSHSYDSVWDTHLSITVGSHGISATLRLARRERFREPLAPAPTPSPLRIP
jgi:hypothetical protein